LTISNSLTTMNSTVFSDCSNIIGTLTIPPSVTTIGANSFEGCSKLVEIKIPRNTTTIGDYAFNNCTGINRITVERATPPTVFTNTFNGINKETCFVTVPTGATLTYMTTSVWQNFIFYYEANNTKIEDNAIHPLILFLNPSNSFINIDFGDNVNSQTLEIFNSIGQKVYDSNLSDNQVQIDISRYSNGLYFVKVVNKNGKILRLGRFVKE